MDWDRITKDIVSQIQEKVDEASAKGVIFGLSGGLDSAVVGALGKRAFPDDILGLIMPCQSNPQDLEHANLLSVQFSIPTQTIVLDESFDSLRSALCIGDDINKTDMAYANIKPRLRMISLYYYANRHNYLVLGTGNRSELMVGYFTKYGDGGTDVLPIGSIYKTDIRDWARFLAVPSQIIEKPPSAGLWSDQTDEGEMGMSYEELDSALRSVVDDEEGTNVAPEIIEKVKDMVKASEHKRNIAPVLKPRL